MKNVLLMTVLFCVSCGVTETDLEVVQDDLAVCESELDLASTVGCDLAKDQADGLVILIVGNQECDDNDGDDYVNLLLPQLSPQFYSGEVALALDATYNDCFEEEFLTAWEAVCE